MDLSAEYETDEGTLVNCSSCGMYKLFTFEEYSEFEKQCINFYSCKACNEKVSSQYYIDDLQRTIVKLKERISYLDSIKDLEKEIDNYSNHISNIDELTKQFANFSLASQSQVSQIGNNVTIVDVDNQSSMTSIWDSEPDLSEHTVRPPQLSFSLAPKIFEISHNSTIHSQVYAGVVGAESSSSATVNPDRNDTADNKVLYPQSSSKRDPKGITSPDITMPNSKAIKIDTVFIGDSFATGLSLNKTPNLHCANYPSAKLDNVVKATEYFSEKHCDLKTVIIHAGINDVRYGKKTEEVKTGFKQLYEKTIFLKKQLVISGPVPTSNCTSNHFSRISALNEWLIKWSNENEIPFVNNFQYEWDDQKLLNRFKTNLNHKGRVQLASNIEEELSKLNSD